MLKRTLFSVFGLLLLFLCTAFMSCNFSEAEKSSETSSVSFEFNKNQLISRNAYSRSGDAIDSFRIQIALRGDYNDTQEVKLSSEKMTASVTFNDVAVGASVRAITFMSVESQLIYLGYSEPVKIQKGKNTITLKFINVFSESIITEQPFAYAQAEDEMYLLYTFKTTDSNDSSGNWIIIDAFNEGALASGVFDIVSRNEDNTIKSFSMTEYICKASETAYQILKNPKAQTFTPSDNTFTLKSESGKDITFTIAGNLDEVGCDTDGTIILPVNANNFNIVFDEEKSSENLYKNYYKIALKAKDIDGNEITDDITWNAKLLYAGKDINQTVINGTPVNFYSFDSENAILMPELTEDGIYRTLLTDGPYQLYISASYDEGFYSTFATIKIPDEYYYNCSANDTEKLGAIKSEIENIKSTVSIKLTGTGSEDIINGLMSSIECSAKLDFSELGLTAIADGMFKYQSNSPYRKYLSILLPETITSIGNEAFYDCSELTEIVLPDGVTEIGEAAFKNCRSLDSIYLPEGLETIGVSAFSGCSSLASLEIPDSVTTIGAHALENMYSLTAIELPSSITAIPDYLFYQDTKLEDIEFKGAITSIGERAFSSCVALEELVLPESVTSIGKYAFSACKKLASFSIPRHVTTINDYVFNQCEALPSITIPATLETIGPYAFSGCSNLSEVMFEEGGNLASIGNSAFKETKLQSIEIPDSVIIIDQYAFYNTSTLTHVTFGSGLKGIGFKAFFKTGVNGTSGTITGLPSGNWKRIQYNDSYPSTYNNAWNLICSHYLEGVAITTDNESKITDANPAAIDLTSEYDFTASSNQNNILYIDVQ